jgi:superfamily I DNA and/or RNA helicase
MSGKIGQKRVNVMLSRAKNELVVVGHLRHVLTFDAEKVCCLCLILRCCYQHLRTIA